MWKDLTMIYNLPSLFFTTLQVFPHRYKPIGLLRMSKHLQLYSPWELMISYGPKFMLGNTLSFRRYYPLTPSTAKASYISVDQDGQLMFFKSNQKDPIKTISKWTEAYQVFVAILAAKYPHEIANIMLYAQTVQKLMNHMGIRLLSSTTKSFAVGGRKTQLHVFGNNKKMQSFIRKHWSWDWIIN